MGSRGPDVRQQLSHLPLFEGLTGPELARLAAGTTRRSLRRGEILFEQGEQPAGFFLIVFGRIALRARTPDAGTRVVDILEGKRSFGEAVMFLGKPYIVSAVALADTVVLHVGRETVFAELEHNPAFARRVIATLSAKLESAVRELETFALASGGRRFASWLLKSVPDNALAPMEVTLPAAKRAVASRLNLSPEHLSRVLRDLADERLIETHGRRVRILDPGRLRAWSGSGAPS